ncbi:hypothetical protein, variant 1 [Aphanomyces astaci]|nr:hypothetical protein, variant 1 [Aphanomyces astaci]ETV85208.1 hypothetical protein, variant 1 [Aphanomyces astaci]|eukprot:XP_009825226.1 hypothetical protein, variant 1 [Aphanomyces astaci]
MGDTFTERVSLYTLLEAASSFDPDHTTAWQQQHSGTIHTSTLTHYVGVEWQLSKPKGFSPRDFCYLDYQDSFFFVDQATGQERRGWARCLHSVDLDCCPDMERSTGIIRAKMIRSGHVFVESTDKQGVLDYYKIYFIVPGGTVLKHFPSLYMKKMLKTFTTSALNLEEYLIQRRLRPILDVPVSTFPLKKDVAACMHCYHRFPWMATKKQCRSCGDVTCPKCSAAWSFHLDPSSYVKVHLCHQCVLDEADLPVAFAARTSRTTSRSSRVHSAPHRSLQCVRPPYARSRVSDAHNRHTPDPRYSRAVYPMSSSQHSEPADDDDEQGRPRVITLDGASPQGNYNYHHHRHPRSRDDNNSNTSSHHRNHPQTPDDDDADGGIVVISPTDWRGSQLTSTSSVREALLTFHSDSSSIYL